ncbi:hypothetical protein B0T11DRAFT_319237 [Plectosphaerella cucumerina]|uniref:NACHT domain-containing protein n=1 Tax=Plectosphaerella cucumerina TaxID=40658 RepID=A0A8K0X1B8_9PEZI|nr:hypothetical protein B0T11DRAFT_319237 [Plectosphaerella cucumerina]
MAEAAVALASLGVAANIFQFFDLAGRIAARGWNLYRNPDRKVEDVFDASTLASFTSGLRDSLNLLGPNMQECDAGMGGVAKDCISVADGLLERLDRLGELARSGRKRDVLKAAVVSNWKQSEMKALEQKLEHFKSQLSLQLLFSIRSFMSQSNTPEQRDVALEARQSQNPTAEELRMLQAMRQTVNNLWAPTPGRYILQYVCSKVSPPNSENLLTELRPTGASQDRGQSAQHKLQDRILSSLYSEVMNDRKIQVSTAHIRTFRWIFMPSSVDDGPWSNFSEWLRDINATLYWVTGKPGSGKSTLMKFIATYQECSSRDTPEVETMLSGAHKEQPWTLVNYFAWYAGQKLQKSVGGLCRSIIYQLARRHPVSLSVLFPSCWEALWLVDDLCPQQMATLEGLRGDGRKALMDMVREVTKTSSIFFLIDGLDEIDNETDEAAQLVLELANLPNVKLCVSSRPWPVFENAFGCKPHLAIQDLTKRDIVTFATDKLSQGVGFTRLQRRDPAYASRLIDQVSEKSAGVFLWVALVVKSIQKGLMEDDRIVDLERRINELPTDLDKLFTRILSNLDQFHLKHARQYFGLLALHKLHYTGEDSKALTLSFADEENPRFAMSMPVKPLSDDEVDERVNTMVRRVESVSRGLLEVVRNTPSSQSRIDYLHRTVVEYLRSGTAHEVLSTTTEPCRDASLNIQMSWAYLCQLKSLESGPGALFGTLKDEFQLILRSIMQFVSHADRELSQDDAIVNEHVAYELLQRTLDSGHWALDHGNLFIDDMLSINSLKGNVTSGRTFLSMVVRLGICNYVRERASRRCLVQRLNDDLGKRGGQAQHYIWPLLADALSMDRISSRMIRQLLQLGTDPDFSFYLPSKNRQTTPMHMVSDSRGHARGSYRDGQCL